MKQKSLVIALSGVIALSLPQAAYANTLTGLIPTVYEALDIVARELIGFVPAVARDSGAERAAVNQPVVYHKAPAAVAEDVVPGQLPPDTGDQTFGSGQLLISKSRAVPFRWHGEEARSVGVTGGLGRKRMQLDQIIQAFRTLSNEIETDVFGVAYKGASRAFGTAGTAPFGTANDLSDTAQPYKILDDNGMPVYNRRMVLGTTGMANLRGKQAVLFRVNEAGTPELLRDGTISRLQGFGLNASAQVAAPASGTGAGYLVNNGAGYAIGATSIAVDTGAGTILAGDIITFAGDTNKYVVATALAAGVVIIGAPGLRQAVADNVAISVQAVATRNMFFCSNAIQLVTRLPALPEEGDSADDRTTITDPVTGLVFELAMYKLYRRVRYEIAIAWGQAVVKTEGVGVLLG